MISQVSISRKTISKSPEEYWNAFNDCLASNDASDLSPMLRKCHLIYWYASEVSNGGHGQYFSNKEETNFREVIEALDYFEAYGHSKILSAAIEIQPDNIDEISDDEAELLGEKENKLDSRFFEEKPDLFDLLEDILKKFESSIVEWTD